MRSGLVKIIFIILVFISISAFFHFYFSLESDPDIFYHFKHAEIYAEQGIFYNQFSRLPYTIIGQNNSDQWYGFHLLLIPFTYFGDPADESGAGRIFGMKLAGVFITSAFLLIFYFTLRKLAVAKPFFWTIFMFFSAPSVLYHLLLIRPHVLSTGLATLLLVFLIDGSVPGVLLISFFISFFHLTFFWLPLSVFGAVFIVKYVKEKIILWQAGFLVLAGILAGWFLRPNPIGSVKLLFWQIFGVAFVKLRGIELNFAKELSPVSFNEIYVFWVFAVVWVGAFLMIYRTGKKSVLVYAAGAISIIFFLMTLFFANRSADLWIAFGALFISLIANYFLLQLSEARKITFNVLLFFLFVFILVRGIYIQSENINTLGWDINMFKGAAEWIKADSGDDEIIFNAAWDYFPFLFFWNDKNRYVSAMDPIMLYGFDKDLYAKSEELRLGDIRNIKDNLLRFNARYIFITKLNEKKLYSNLSKNADFETGYEDEYVAVFKLK